MSMSGIDHALVHADRRDRHVVARPGASTVARFWRNLVEGRDCLTRSSRAALRQRGTAAEAPRPIRISCARSRSSTTSSGSTRSSSTCRRGEAAFTGSVAPAVPRVRVGVPRERRRRARARARRAPACSAASRATTSSRRCRSDGGPAVRRGGIAAGAHRQRARLPDDARVAQAGPQRAELRRDGRVRDVADGDRPRGAEPASRRMRARAGGRLDRAPAAERRLHRRRRGDAVGVGPAAPVRRGGRRHDLRQRRRRRRAAPARRCACRGQPDPRGDPRLRVVERRQPAGQGELHRARAPRARSWRSRRRSPTPASRPKRSATSRRTAPARASAIRSRSPRSPRCTAATRTAPGTARSDR